MRPALGHRSTRTRSGATAPPAAGEKRLRVRTVLPQGLEERVVAIAGILDIAGKVRLCFCGCFAPLHHGTDY